MKQREGGSERGDTEEDARVHPPDSGAYLQNRSFSCHDGRERPRPTCSRTGRELKNIAGRTASPIAIDASEGHRRRWLSRRAHNETLTSSQHETKGAAQPDKIILRKNGAATSFITTVLSLSLPVSCVHLVAVQTARVDFASYAVSQLLMKFQLVTQQSAGGH